MKIRITKSGEIFFLYEDNHPCLQLGPLQVERASDVTFNSALQMWEILRKNPDGSTTKIGTPHKNRTDAIMEEVRILEGEMGEIAPKMFS